MRGFQRAVRARRAALVPLLGLLALAGCGGSSHPAAQTQAKDGCTSVSKPHFGQRTEKAPKKNLPAATHYSITLLTNCGSFTFRLDQAESPHAAAAFVELVQDGYFNETLFHRIIPGFVIQGGDPTGTGDGGPGFTTIDTPPASAVYTHGVVAMAKAGNQPNGAAGSQFFVVTAANAELPPQYAIIGTVTSGLAVVDLIGKYGIATGATQGEPTKVIVLEKATVSTSG
jgi:cyclophilin family peptidyl-prolyl cis-trans isomerase